MQTPQLKGWFPQDCPPLQMPVPSKQVPRVLTLLSNFATKLGVPTTPQFNNLLEWLTRFRESFISIYQVIIKNIIKDADEQPDEEVHRVRSGRVPSAGALSPGVEVCHPSSMWTCSPTQRLSKPYCLGFLWRLHH